MSRAFQLKRKKKQQCAEGNTGNMERNESQSNVAQINLNVLHQELMSCKGFFKLSYRLTLGISDFPHLK